MPEGAGIDPVTGVFSWTPVEGQAPGEYPLTVMVADDDPAPLHDEETFTVRVFTEEPQVVCDVTPGLLDFGAVALQDSVSQSFTIRNQGFVEFSGEISEVCDHFGILEGGGPFTLAAGDSLVVDVVFSPPLAGDYSCLIQLGQDGCTVVECLGSGRDAAGVELPAREYSLMQNVPNPFNPMTKISFNLATESHASLVIFDVAGRQITSLVNGVKSAGKHSVVWDGRNEFGQQAAAGVYFFRLEAGSFSETKRMVLVK